MSRARFLLVCTVVATGYFAAGRLGLSLATVHPSTTPVWAPTGIAMAAILRLGYRVWPAIGIGAFLVNLATLHVVGESLAIAVGNTLEAVVCRKLISTFAPQSPWFRRPMDVFAFTALAAMTSTLVSATIGVLSLCAFGKEQLAVGEVWSTWWLGDATGALIAAPPILLWSTGASAQRLRQQWLEALILLLVIVAVGQAVFGGWLPEPVERLEFLGVPALVWVAFRFGPREAAAATLVMSAIAILGTVAGHGPFTQGSPNAALLLLQTYMGVVSLMALTLSAAVDDGRRTEGARLGEARERLRAHAALEQSEPLHRAIAELASDFAVIARVHDGAIVLELATEGFRQVTGYGAEELTAPAAWQRLFAGDADGELRNAGRRLVAGERVELELPICTKSGGERWLRCHAEAFRGPEPDRGVRILGAAEDVTARRQQDEELRRHQQAIRALSTPVLRIRDRLLLVPVIGEVDDGRAQHLAAELLRQIRSNRARVAVIDMTGMAAMTAEVAHRILGTIDACRLLGAAVIVTGLSYAIADRLVAGGVDLSRLTSLGDLQSGMEAAERVLAGERPATRPAVR